MPRSEDTACNRAAGDLVFLCGGRAVLLVLAASGSLSQPLRCSQRGGTVRHTLLEHKDRLGAAITIAQMTPR
eukprot:3217255-Pleurochrysis_carterae.AAC.1